MVERRRNDVTDGVSWWCRTCKSRKSIREGSFFSKSRLTLQKWLILMYMWAREYPVKDAAEEAEVQEKTAIDLYQWLREVCSTRLIADGPVVLGGPGSIVQIDESLFRHKPKVVTIICNDAIMIFVNQCCPESSGKSNNQGSVGFRHGRHFSHPCVRVHADCT